MSLNLSRLVENPNYLEEKQQYLSIKGIGHIESKRIQLIKELGEGAFGRVSLTFFKLKVFRPLFDYILMIQLSLSIIFFNL